jgi:hypothetical protein
VNAHFAPDFDISKTDIKLHISSNKSL